MVNTKKIEIFNRGIQKCPYCNEYWSEHSPEVCGSLIGIWFCEKSLKYIVEIVDYRVHIIFNDYDSASKFKDKWGNSEGSYKDISRIVNEF